MDKERVASLLDALCEGPLADGQTEPSAELQALRREAAKTLSQAGDAQDDPDRLTAALAVLLSGTDVEAARRTVEDAALRSAAARLDMQSAIAFVDAGERSPESAPAHLVDEMVAADAAGLARSAAPQPMAGTAGMWSLIDRSLWSAPRWRMAAVSTALVVVAVAGVLSGPLYWQRTNPALQAPPAPPMASAQPAAADAPVPAKPALAINQPCERGAETGEATAAKNRREPAGTPESIPATADCAAPGNQFADRPAAETEAIATRLNAEAARQAAAAREAVDAAGKVGAAQAGREADPGFTPADRSGSMFGATGHYPAAAARTAPAAAPAARPAGAR